MSADALNPRFLNGLHVGKRSGGERLRSEALRDKLVRQIGSLRPGDKLASERKLARQSGLSLLTVNKVVSNLVTEGMLERQRGVGTFVRAAAGDVGANGRASKLKLIRYVARDPGAAISDSEGYIANFFRGIRKSAALQGFEVLPTAFDEADGLERLPADLFDADGVDGAIFVECRVPDYTPLWKFIEEGRRIVAFDYSAPERGLSSVCFDNAGAMREAVRRFVEIGHRRIGYIGPGGYVGQPQDERIAGFRQGISEAGLDAQAAPVVLGDDEAIGRQLNDLMASRCRPTAFALFHDWHLQPLDSACAKLGLAIPRDVSAVGFGDAMAREREPRWRMDSIVFDEEDMGRAAFELVASGARGVVRRFPGRLISRGTSGPPGAS